MKKCGILLICLLSIISCAAEENGARKFVSNLYSNYAKNNKSFAYNGPRADTIFSPELLKLIRKDEEMAKGEVGFLDADPLCSCQDSKGLKIEGIEVTTTADNTYAEIKLKFPKETKKIILKLEKAENKWLISDVVDSSTSVPSLVDYLSKSLNNDTDTTKTK